MRLFGRRPAHFSFLIQVNLIKNFVVPSSVPGSTEVPRVSVCELPRGLCGVLNADDFNNVPVFIFV